MSDSDDTDTLLLIPPDFFVINSSDSEDEFAKPSDSSLYGSTLRTLFQQMDNLESRINSIEVSEVEKLNSTLASNDFTLPSLQLVNSTDDLYEPQARSKFSYSIPVGKCSPPKISSNKEIKEKTNTDIPPLNSSPLKEVTNDSDDNKAYKNVHPVEVVRLLHSIRHNRKDTVSAPQLHSKTENGGSQTSLSGLFSLSSLWGSNLKHGDSPAVKDEASLLLPRLEEEKCRRRHCEQLIQTLQAQLLELQEKLAVAVHVDNAKDEALTRLHKEWDNMLEKHGKFESEYETLQQQFVSSQNKSEKDMKEVTKKLLDCDKEVLKALELAQENEQKSAVLENEKVSLHKEIKCLKLEVEKISNEMVVSVEQEKKLAATIVRLENELKSGKAQINEAVNEKVQALQQYEKYCNEIKILREQNDALRKDLDKYKTDLAYLNSQKSEINSSLVEAKRKEQMLQQQLGAANEEIETSKKKLRDFYQQQVESLVQNKLVEFRGQLDEAHRSMQEQIQSRERAVAVKAAQHLRKLTEKHHLEVKLLEEKHKEEVRLCKLQLTQAEQQSDALRKKLDQQESKHSQLAEQLHNIMEKQWLEAVRVIKAQDDENRVKEDERSLSRTADELIFNTSVDTLPVSLKTQSRRDKYLQKYVETLLNVSASDPPEKKRVDVTVYKSLQQT